MGNKVIWRSCHGEMTMKRFWECDCCMCMIVTAEQDDASEYECPQCKISGCEELGTFVEIPKKQFMGQAR